MGTRKKLVADARKEENKAKAFARLNNCPISPRKMRLVADMVRGADVNDALAMLKFSPKEASFRLEKLVLSAISNWQVKNEDERVEDAELMIKEIKVDEGRTLKRIRPRAQGRAYRINKRSCHVYVLLGERAEELTNVETNN